MARRIVLDDKILFVYSYRNTAVGRISSWRQSRYRYNKKYHGVNKLGMGRPRRPLFGCIRRGIFADKSILIGHTRAVACGVVFRAALCAHGFRRGKNQQGECEEFYQINKPYRPYNCEFQQTFRTLKLGIIYEHGWRGCRGPEINRVWKYRTMPQTTTWNNISRFARGSLSILCAA